MTRCFLIIVLGLFFSCHDSLIENKALEADVEYDLILNKSYYRDLKTIGSAITFKEGNEYEKIHYSDILHVTKSFGKFRRNKNQIILKDTVYFKYEFVSGEKIDTTTGNTAFLDTLYLHGNFKGIELISEHSDVSYYSIIKLNSYESFWTLDNRLY